MKTLQIVWIIPFILSCLVSYSNCLVNNESIVKQELQTQLQDSQKVPQQIHSISIEQLKNELEKALSELKNTALKSLHEILPDISEIVESKYIPTIEAIKEDFGPIFESKISPKLQKLKDYTKTMGGKIFTKAYQSWELSNSTHINLVPFSGIVEEIAGDIQDLHQHGSYFTKAISRTSRVKRSPQLLSSVFGFAKPFFKSFASSMARSMDSDDNTLASRFFLPIIFDMVDDPVTFHDLQRLFWSVQAIASPVIYEMSRSQYSGTSHIPQAVINAALQRFEYETKPIIRKILERQLPSIAKRAADNHILIIRTIQRIEESAGPRMNHLKMLLKNFFQRHSPLFGAVGKRYINSRTLMAMKHDFTPIKTVLLEIFFDYMSRNNSAWGNLFSNSFTLLSRL